MSSNIKVGSDPHDGISKMLRTYATDGCEIWWVWAQRTTNDWQICGARGYSVDEDTRISRYDRPELLYKALGHLLKEIQSQTADGHPYYQEHSLVVMSTRVASRYFLDLELVFGFEPVPGGSVGFPVRAISKALDNFRLFKEVFEKHSGE